MNEAHLVDHLTECMDNMMDSFNARSKGDSAFSVFYENKDEDLKEIQKHIDALDIIIRYYNEVPA